MVESPGVTLRRLLISIGEPLVDLQVDATGLDAPVRGVSILDPDDELGSYPDELVLVIGARGRDAIRFVRAAARGGAAAAAVKVSGSSATELRDAAAEAGIALLAVRPGVRWDQLETLVREGLDSAALAAGSGDAGQPGELFSLAQTVAVLTGGSVSIEDAGNRVLAYSRSDDEVDELRRLSILGWQGPEPYLAMLREWGVFQRLRAGEEVVRIDERPELGIRRRLAVGIKAGTHHLGIIWVQEGREPFAERAESALVGASRMAAMYLLRQRSDTLPGSRSRQELVTGLLAGRASADLVAGHLGLDPSTPAVVLAFAPPPEPDLSARELHLAELGNVVSVHVTSYRRAALVGTIGSRVYAVLPDVARRADPALAGLAGDIAEVLRRRVGEGVQVGIGSPADSLGTVVKSRAEADRVLDAMARKRTAGVATIAELRAEVLLGETLALLEGNPDLRDPGVAALRDHDTAHGSDLVASLLAYLDAMGDVRSAAAKLHVHPNTLRHRVRRAGQITGIDLDDPHARLSCHLQLLLTLRHP